MTLRVLALASDRADGEGPECKEHEDDGGVDSDSGKPEPPFQRVEFIGVVLIDDDVERPSE